MTSYSKYEEDYANYINKRRWAKANRGAKCPSTKENWVAVGDEQFPTSKYAFFTCLVCDAEFVWDMGPYHTTCLYNDDELELTGSCEGPLSDMPWWGWPLMIAIIPFAIPMALIVIIGEKIYFWCYKRCD